MKLLAVLAIVAGCAGEDYHTGIHKLEKVDGWEGGVETACVDRIGLPPFELNPMPGCVSSNSHARSDDPCFGTFLYDLNDGNNGTVRGCCNAADPPNSLWFFECDEQ